MRYYSQAGEDKFLYENIFRSLDLHSGIYLEMGALDGLLYSNTKFFEEQLDWTGVLIEPHPTMFKSLQQNRPNNKLYNCIVSSEQEPLEFQYFENKNLSAVSGISKTLTENSKQQFYENKQEWFAKMRDQHLKKVTMTPRSLASILQDAQINHINFCSIDVEGHELEVLKSFSFDCKVDLFLIEKNPNSIEIEELLSNQNFIKGRDVAHNELYFSKEFLDFSQLEVNDLGG